MDYIFRYASPLGGITLGSNGEALVGLWFDRQKYFASTLAPVHEEKTLPVFLAAKRWLDLYFSGSQPDFTPKLELRATRFRRLVWEALAAIPYGTTATYGEIAARIAKQANLPRVSARAVGGAVGHNPVSLIIPCHRVVGAGGCLTGYAAGLSVKQRLLELEKRIAP